MARRKNTSTKLTPLTTMQMRFLEALSGSASPKEAALKAGYSEKRIDNTVIELLNSKNVRDHVRQALSENGIFMDSLGRYLRQSWDAQRWELNRQGDSVEVGPDWQVRMKGLELAAKLMGVMPDPRLELSGLDGGAVVVRHTASLDEPVVDAEWTETAESHEPSVPRLAEATPSQLAGAILEVLQRPAPVAAVEPVGAGDPVAAEEPQSDPKDQQTAFRLLD